MRDPKKWTVVGAGYTGARLAARLAADGCAVVVTRRRLVDAEAVAAAAGPGVRAAAVDLADAGALRQWIEPGGVVVDSVPPVPGDVGGERALIAAARDAGAARVIYLSSTGVYPPSPPGSERWIDEEVAPAPSGARGADRLAAERALLDEAARLGVDAISLRLSGIYGPGRGLPERVRAGAFRVVGAGDTFVCRIHVDDIVDAVRALAIAERVPSRIYNLADDEPATSREVADAVAAWLGLSPPPSAPVETLPDAVVAMLTANRRIDNRRIKRELGFALRYPTWREGFRHALGLPLLEHE